MQNLFEPLTETELDQLDRFLLDRIEEHAANDGRDEGVLDVSELDGLFTAMISGPVVIQPSQWLPVVWGDFEPAWESEQEFEAILSLLIRHMNSITALLMNQGDYFEPIFLEKVQDGKTYTIVDEWCEGYLHGVALAAEQWEAAGQKMTDLLTPIRAFTEAAGWPAHELSSEVEIDTVRNAITPNVREIHAWWLARREDEATASQPARRPESRVGRNDPCPCGSGKKYKKCCLH